MLNGSFYKISIAQASEGKVQAEVSFDPQHEIFKGHYPGQPVVPGACLLQLVRDVLQIALQEELQLEKADYLKFMVPVVPESNQSLIMQVSYSLIESGSVKVNATLSGEANCFKLQAWYKRYQQLAE